MPGNFEHRHACATGLHLDFDLLVAKFTVTQLLAEAFARGRARSGTDKGVEHALFGRLLGARLHIFPLLFANKRNADLDQITNDLLDVASHIANFGKFGRLDLEKWRAGKPGKTPRDLGLANAGRSNHQDILRQNLLAQFLVELQSPPTVAQGDRDGAFGVALADDVAVEFGHNFAGGEVGQRMYPLRFQGFDSDVAVGENTDFGGDIE